MRIKTTCAALLGLLLWLFLPAAAHASLPANEIGQNTQIVWSRFADLDFSAARIVIADPQGRHVSELTHSSNGVQDTNPQLSPDGRRLVFERDLPDGAAQIVVVGSDGRGERVLNLGCVAPCSSDLAPLWAPDGEHILFTRVVGPFDQVNGSARSAVLWRADLRGQHVIRVSAPGIDGAFEDYQASFAPDGYVIFVRVRNADPGGTAVFRMANDGTHVRQLTPWSINADSPFVSPARTGPTRGLVVFETGRDASAVATIPATCRSESDCAARIRYLTSRTPLPAQNFNPAWSPDGRRIVFVNFSSTDSAPPRGDIWTMRWDGTDLKAVSLSPLFEFRPTWGRAPS